MGLSGRELTLILRARDEASRTLGRLSSGMSKLDRDAQRISAAQVRTSQRNLVSLRRDMHDIEEAYQRQTLAAREAYFASKKDATAQRAYQRAMLDAQQLRVKQISQNRLLRQQQEDFIDAQREHLRLLAEERDAQRHYNQNLLATGTALAATGATITYVGIRATEAFAGGIQAAIDYQQEVARTATQVDKAGASLQQISDIGKEVADSVPVAFEEIQPALYDIFSSIDTNVTGARTILKQFAQDAVGGQVDMATATKANLAIMNAYKLSAKDSAAVSDFMFRLVQKGVGTYEDFAKVIGRSIPSAARAGQTYQTLGAMLAFMTRNGMSAAMASTSAARALDAVSNPKTVGRLEDMGVKVKNLKGEFLPLPDILSQMQDKFKGLTRPELAEKLQALFAGAGGTIQARRFFDMYFKNSDEFNKRVKEMGDTAGQAEKAFDQMAETPQAKLQRLKNDWMLLRIEIGENLMPVAMKLVGWANDMVDAYQNLSPETKKVVEITGAAVAVLTILVGVLTTLSGVLLILKGGFGIVRMAMVDNGATAKSLAGKFGMALASIFLLIDGLHRMKSASSETERAFGSLEVAAGAAFLGFRVAGPIGAAIAVGTTLIIGMSSAGEDLRAQEDKIKASIDGVVDSLNKQTGAFTKATKAAAAKSLEDAGLLSVAQDLGIPLDQVTKASMMNGEQMKRMFGVWADSHNWTTAQQTAFFGLQEGIKDVNQELFDSQAAWGRNREAMGKSVPQAIKVKEAITKVGDAYNLIPKDVKTIVKTINDKPTMKTMRQLQKQYALTPKDIITILKTVGGKDAESTIKKITKAAKQAGDVAPDLTGFVEGLRKGLAKAIRATKTDTGAVSKELKNGTKDAKPNLNPFIQNLHQTLNTAKGNAGAGGAGIGTSLKTGVLNGIAGLGTALSAAVAGAVRSAIAAGRAAAKAKSPSKEMYDLGVDMVDGLTLAFSKNKDKPSKEASKMIKRIFKQIQKDILHDLGEEGFNVNMGKFLDIAKTFFEKHLPKSLKGKDRTKRVKTLVGKLADDIEHDVKRLEKINKKLRQVKKDLADRQADLENVQGQKASFRGAIADYGSFSSFGLDTQGLTAAKISAEMTKRVQQVYKFGQDLATLKAMGFSQDVINMIIAMPIADAIAYAAALVKATPEQLSNINAGVSAISGVGGLADQISGAMYDAGIAAAQALVDGLQAKEDDLEKIARKLGHKIAQAIKDELKMKSPSKVALAISRNFGDSLGRGLSESERPLTSISSRLAAAMQPSPDTTYTSRPVVGASARGGGGGGTTVQKTEQHISVYTHEIDPRANAAKLGWELTNRTGF